MQVRVLSTVPLKSLNRVPLKSLNRGIFIDFKKYSLYISLMIIKTKSGNYRPGDDDTIDQFITFSCDAIFVAGEETRASLKDAMCDSDAIS